MNKTDTTKRNRGRVVSGAAALQEQPSMPPQSLRTFITFLLFLHLFALFAGVAGYFGARSGLRRQLLDVPAIQPYLQILHLDTACNFHWIFGTSEDWDHQCEIELNVTGPSADNNEAEQAKEKLFWMPPDTRPGIRRRRYRSLALNLSLLEDDDNSEAFLVQAMANAMLRERGITEGSHRFYCRAQQPQGMNRFESLPPSQRDPSHPRWYLTVYEADLAAGADGWSPLKRAGRSEMTQSGERRDSE